TRKADIGYIAEDFEALGLKDLVVYDDKGLASSIKYDRIPLYLVEIVKAQETKIADLEKRIKALEEKK
ncbi:MAG: hypothetical protein PHY94_06820, partial [Candidatus Omnitrophica bacterium]|nr:hypothetical protein [Candidatus Omnitrophota bacterium]